MPKKKSSALLNSYRGTIGAVLLVIGIIGSAFGAHALKKIVSPDQVDSFATAMEYLIYNGLGFIALSQREAVNGLFSALLGSLLFSQSIVLLVLTDISTTIPLFGLVTPIGGTLMIIGWSVIGFCIFKQEKIGASV